MISREQIESILKVNGLSPGSADDQIRSILLSARYSKDEIDTAIMILREDMKTHKSRVDGLHKVFRSGQALRADEISQLLGIDVTVNNAFDAKDNRRDVSMGLYAFIWVLSVAVAVSGILFYMYMHKVGVFHPSVYLTSSR